MLYWKAVNVFVVSVALICQSAAISNSDSYRKINIRLVQGIITDDEAFNILERIGTDNKIEMASPCVKDIPSFVQSGNVVIGHFNDNGLKFWKDSKTWHRTSTKHGFTVSIEDPIEIPSSDPFFKTMTVLTWNDIRYKLISYFRASHVDHLIDFQNGLDQNPNAQLDTSNMSPSNVDGSLAFGIMGERWLNKAELERLKALKQQPLKFEKALPIFTKPSERNRRLGTRADHKNQKYPRSDYIPPRFECHKRMSLEGARNVLIQALKVPQRLITQPINPDITTGLCQKGRFYILTATRMADWDDGKKWDMVWGSNNLMVYKEQDLPEHENQQQHQNQPEQQQQHNYPQVQPYNEHCPNIWSSGATSYQQPVVYNQPPVVYDQEPVVYNQQGLLLQQEPERMRRTDSPFEYQEAVHQPAVSKYKPILPKVNTQVSSHMQFGRSPLGPSNDPNHALSNPLPIHNKNNQFLSQLFSHSNHILREQTPQLSSSPSSSLPSTTYSPASKPMYKDVHIIKLSPPADQEYYKIIHYHHDLLNPSRTDMVDWIADNFEALKPLLPKISDPFVEGEQITTTDVSEMNLELTKTVPFGLFSTSTKFGRAQGIIETSRDAIEYAEFVTSNRSDRKRNDPMKEPVIHLPQSSDIILYDLGVSSQYDMVDTTRPGFFYDGLDWEAVESSQQYNHAIHKEYRQIADLPPEMLLTKKVYLIYPEAPTNKASMPRKYLVVNYYDSAHFLENYVGFTLIKDYDDARAYLDKVYSMERGKIITSEIERKIPKWMKESMKKSMNVIIHEASLPKWDDDGVDGTDWVQEGHINTPEIIYINNAKLTVTLVTQCWRQQNKENGLTKLLYTLKKDDRDYVLINYFNDQDFCDYLYRKY